jgi:hypothetical protein
VDIAALTGERRNKAPVYVYGVRDMRKLLDCIRAKSGELAAKLKSEYLMLVPEAADRFRATISALLLL